MLHVTTGLESGGAETLLAKLVGRLDREQFECAVVSLTDEGPVLGGRIRALGVPLHCLGGHRGVPHPRLIRDLIRIVRCFRPHVVQTWLYHADLVGALASPFYRRAPLVWGVHNTALDPMQAKRLTLMVVRLNALLSRWAPARIVCCSDAARQDHARLGYAARKLRVVTNGIDTGEFVPDPPARGAVREELGLSPETPLVGLVARFDPQKDHRTFLRAAGLLHRARPDAHFVLCGTGVTDDNAALAGWVAEAGVGAVTHLLGLRRDSARVTAALDAATVCSCYGESFGLALGEAMACGVPVVTTALAGPAEVVGEEGWVVPVGDAPALAGAWQEMLALTANQREERGARARRRICTEFSLDRMVHGYEALYREVADMKADRDV